MFSHFGNISHTVEMNFRKECDWCGGVGALETESVWWSSANTNPIVRTSKIYIIFVKPFSNNPSPSFPGQIRSRKFWSKKSFSYAGIIFQRDTSNTFEIFCLIKSFNTSLKNFGISTSLVHSRSSNKL